MFIRYGSYRVHYREVKLFKRSFEYLSFEIIHNGHFTLKMGRQRFKFIVLSHDLTYVVNRCFLSSITANTLTRLDCIYE
jgi:hypothetical protein